MALPLSCINIFVCSNSHISLKLDGLEQSMHISDSYMMHLNEICCMSCELKHTFFE